MSLRRYPGTPQVFSKGAGDEDSIRPVGPPSRLETPAGETHGLNPGEYLPVAPGTKIGPYEILGWLGYLIVTGIVFGLLNRRNPLAN